ncbi:MAG: response regulator [Spirochaetales bacterium]|nr:response regulator [Spirochaetales bacterium]
MGCTRSAPSPVVRNGFIDLSGADFYSGQLFPLNGDWMYYPEQFVSLTNEKGILRAVPGALPRRFTWGTYRLVISLPEYPGSLALFSWSPESSCRILVDGKPVAHAGIPSSSRSGSVPDFKPEIIPLQPENRTIELVVQISNFYIDIGGIRKSFYIGSYGAVSEYYLQGLVEQTAISGALLIIALYHIAFFLIRRKEQSSLLLGLFSLLICLRPFIYDIFPLQNLCSWATWQFRYHAGMLSFYLAVPLFIYYMKYIFHTRFPKYFAPSSAILAAVFTLAEAVLPVHISTQFLVAYQIAAIVQAGLALFVVIRSLHDRRTFAMIFLAGLLFMLVTVFHDILVSAQIISGRHLVPYGLSGFILMQAILLSIRFSRGFNQLEKMTDMQSLLLEKQKETEIELERRVHERTEALLEARNEALRASRAKSEFLTNMSHEMRTPLNGIIGFSELLVENPGKEQTSTYASLIASESDKLLWLINQLLDLARVESGKTELKPRPINLAAFIYHTCSPFRMLAGSKGLEFNLEVEDSVPDSLLIDAELLGQVLINLIGNAVKFTHSGSIHVFAGCRNSGDDSVLIDFSISDTGIGIPEEMQTRIFDAFTQVESGMQREYQGSGLGTAIARQLVSIMNGKIRLESKIGKGSCFSFTLPLVKSLNPPENILGKVKETAKIKPSLHGLKVLLAEDYPPNQQLALIHLERLGCMVSLAVNGREAVEMTNAGDFDLVLMDIQMPEMDGLEATRIIRQNHKDLPVVGITANAFEADHRLCLEAGMNGVLRKPFRKEEFIREIAACMNIHPAPEKKGKKQKKQIVPSGDIFDAVQLFSDVYEERELFLELINGFIEETEKMIAGIDMAIRQGNDAVIHRNAHSVKGGALNVYAGRLRETALALETAAKNMQREKYAALFTAFADSFNEFREYCSNPSIVLEQQFEFSRQEIGE